MWNREQAFTDPVHLEAMLFDAAGELVATWPIPLRPDLPVFIDSASDGPWRKTVALDGVLALYACTESEPSPHARKMYNRLFPILDWRTQRQLITLHSDHTVRRGYIARQQFTEIVIVENDQERNALIILNGEEPQSAGALEIVVENSAGSARSAVYTAPMRPFTVHRVEFATLFPDLEAFSRGEPLLVSGKFESKGLFTRPYIETTGPRWGAYHAGDLYQWAALPHFAHALIGGEVNPAAVRHDNQTRTIVNLLHSHGDLEDDMQVDATLFDADGVCAVRRSCWRLLPRKGLARFDVSELLPEPDRPFYGHIALSFAAVPGRAVPRHLQALLEYQCADSVARVMTWSDEWNSKPRQVRRDRGLAPAINRSYYRVREDEDTSTEIAVVNPGHADYQHDAEIRMTLVGVEGPVMEAVLNLPPYGSRQASIEEIFPGARVALAPTGLGLIIAESASDLANIAYTRDRRSGALAAEHFLWLQTEHEGKFVFPSGS